MVKLNLQHSQFFLKKIDHVGGASVVAKHVAASGNKANLITVLGNDELKKFAINDLKNPKLIIMVLQINLDLQ